MSGQPFTRRCRNGILPLFGLAAVLFSGTSAFGDGFVADPVFDTATASTGHGLIREGPNEICSPNSFDDHFPHAVTYIDGDPNKAHLYQKYDFYNNGPSRCVQVKLDWKHDNCDFEIGLGMYLGSFNPDDPTQNLLSHSYTLPLEGNGTDAQVELYRYSPGFYHDPLNFGAFNLDEIFVSAVVPALSHIVIVLDSTRAPGLPGLVCPKPTGSLFMWSEQLSEDAPELSVGDARDYEFGPLSGDGGTLRFGLSLAAQAAVPVTIHVKTSDGTAVSTGPTPDYTPVEKDVTFQPGETFKYVDVPIVGDTIDEHLTSPETMTLTLSNPNPAAIPVANTTATGKIDDDDSLVGTCHIQSPGTQLPFGVVGQPYGPVPMVADGEVAGEFSWSFVNSSCLPPGLQLHDGSNANASIDGTPTAAGTYTCTVHLICPTSDSGTESHDSPITITIQPETPQFLVTLDGASVVEGNSGFTPVLPQIHLSSPAPAAFTLEVSLQDGSAFASDPDYQTLAPGQLIGINKGDTIVPIPLNVIGDLKVEADEHFVVTLRTPVSHELVAEAGVTIVNDDLPVAPSAIPTLGHGTLALLGVAIAALAVLRLRSGD